MTPRAPRKNLMLAAAIEAGSLSVPVRIRNLSEAGAMIDGPTLPEPGSTLLLTRLDLSVGATVIWSGEGRCGLRLNGEIAVDDWVAGVRRPGSGASLGQLQVDQIQAALRTGAVMPPEEKQPVAPPGDAEPIGKRVAAELARVKRMLDSANDELSDDVELLTRHARALQSLDVAAAIVDSLAAVIAADGAEEAIAAVPMHEVRSRLSGLATLT